MKEEEEERKEISPSLAEWLTTFETLGISDRVRVHPDYIDKHGNLLVKPSIIYGVETDGTPQSMINAPRDEDHTLTMLEATVATEASLQPTSPKIYYLYGIWVNATGSFGANRNFQPKITNGTAEMPMCSALSVADGTFVQLWPEKAADNERACMPPFPISNSYYLVIEDAMAAAEFAEVWVTYVHRSSEL